MNIETLKAMALRHHALQPLEITFVPGVDGFRMLALLSRYAEEGYVKFESHQLALAILSTSDWGRTGRRLIMHFVAGQLWSESEFMLFAQLGIERIKVACDSPLSTLQSGRQRVREEALAKIATSVLTAEVRSEISEWGLKVNFHQREAYGLYSIYVTVENNRVIAFSLILDAWSGNLLTLEGKILCSCSSYQTAQNELRNMLADYLEVATA